MVVLAQRIPVHEQGGLSVQAGYGRIGKRLRTGRPQEPAEHEEVAISMHEQHRGPTRRKLGERACYARIERLGEIVVSGPVFEQVAKDVERVSLGRDTAQEVEEDLVDPWALRREM